MTEGDDRRPADPDADWESPAPADPDGADAALIVDVAGFEGPLDLLLTLARSQKVDLAAISIVALADQYLDYVDRARAMRLDVAADYLVMAAWLAFLKSRLLLPVPETPEDGPSAEDVASMLALRLKRLETIRAVAERLAERPRLGREVFARGDPEPVAVDRRATFDASLYDLLSAYAAQRRKHLVTRVEVRRRTVWALAEAREILSRLVGEAADWVPVDDVLAPWLATPDLRATVRASTFSAALELVREGRLEMRQSGAFAPLYLKAADGSGE